MRFLDLLRMSSSSLWKRKVRTILTVFGVVIGTASIVVMISLGLGLNQATIKQMEEYGGLTTITVYEGNTMDKDSVEVKEEDRKRLTDEALDTISQLEHIEVISPVLNVNVMAKFGVYEANLNVIGMTTDSLENMGIEVAEGTLPNADAGKLEFFYGNQVLLNFNNTKGGGGGYWETGELPDIKYMTDPLFIIFDTDAYYSSQNPPQDGTVVAPPKKYIVRASGYQAGTPEDYTNYSWNVYCDIKELQTQLKKVFKNKTIPGQPTTSAGKPYKQIFYNSFYINVDDMENVTSVQKAITDLGYQAESNMEWVEYSKEQYKNIQAVLGGIGAVSLFVAAIGITNTMMMSIYERTKEIGVMKVLGCNIHNIQAMFLLEAGYIGFIGGVFGIGLSYVISEIINTVIAKSGNQMIESFIPSWLSLSAIVFAVVVGMVAGFFPSLRAMRLSPLAAIRNE